ncbi:hypothetical protein GXW82_08890 [Streptacidiphilus sp. 4-A2]|nr:hypothetical protein [Streptacidiphilus sp. 4-A2]
MTTVDWFANSKFIPSAVQEAVSRDLDQYFENLATCAKDLGITDANIYVGGSLARQEPSVTQLSGEWRLFSDLDLLAVVRGPVRPGHPIHGLAAEMRSRHPSFETTLFVVDSADFGKLRSLVGHDAWPMFGHPVVEALQLDLPERARIGRVEQFEIFTHQLNSLVLFPHDEGGVPGQRSRHQREFAGVHLLKTLIEALRISLPGARAENFGDLCTEPFRSGLAPLATRQRFPGSFARASCTPRSRWRPTVPGR